jgi:hypothetical protein
MFYNLLSVYMKERAVAAERHRMEKLDAHVARAQATYRSWPKWKQDVACEVLAIEKGSL